MDSKIAKRTKLLVFAICLVCLSRTQCSYRNLPCDFSVLSQNFLSVQVSICLECNSSKLRGLKRKWIRCSAQATVLHLKKFIAKKLNLTSFNEVCDPSDLKLYRPLRCKQSSKRNPLSTFSVCLDGDLWHHASRHRCFLHYNGSCVSHHTDFKAPPRCHDSHKAFNVPHIFRDK